MSSKFAVLVAGLCSVAVTVSTHAAETSAVDMPSRHWVAAWGAPPDLRGTPLSGKTIRQIVRPSIGGSSMRVRLSNLFGTAPVRIGPVRVAKHARGSAIAMQSDRALLFGGQSSVTIPAGDSVLSDPVTFPVVALDNLAVSLYVSSSAGPSTIHNTAIDTAFIAAGDVTSAPNIATYEVESSRFFLMDVEVAASVDANAIVILGDSITDGVGSTEDGNARWPDALADRLQADPAFRSIAVINSGISGNRLLNDGSSPFIGPSSLSRFDRDVLSKAGVRWVILLQGSNDISAADMLATPKDKVSAQQIIDGMKQLIARAHLKGVKIFGATLLPMAGVEKPFVRSIEGAAKQRQVSEWIRTSGAFDAVIDFEQVMRDPARPEHLLPLYDSGDHLHPNDAGYKAMAAAIDLSLFAR